MKASLLWNYLTGYFAQNLRNLSNIHPSGIIAYPTFVCHPKIYNKSNMSNHKIGLKQFVACQLTHTALAAIKNVVFQVIYKVESTTKSNDSFTSVDLMSFPLNSVNNNRGWLACNRHSPNGASRVTKFLS